LYVREAHLGARPPARDLGLPPDGPDGVYEYVLDGLDPDVSYAVSVSAYGADGAESELSNEIVLASRAGPCQGRSEQAACDAGDVCVAGRCAGGACTLRWGPGTAEPGSALRARLVIRRGIVYGAGSFVTLGRVDPRPTGVAVELADAGGAPRFRADVPGDAFRVRGRSFRYAARATTPGGVRRLVLRRRGDVLEVRLAAFAAAALASAPEPLTWVVRMGAECVRQTGVRCAARPGRLLCS
jgi:hypothetical protein